MVAAALVPLVPTAERTPLVAALVATVRFALNHGAAGANRDLQGANGAILRVHGGDLTNEIFVVIFVFNLKFRFITEKFRF